MRIFKTKWFARYARRERIEDESLCDAVERITRGGLEKLDSHLSENLL